MERGADWSIETKRLRIRRSQAVPDDIDFIHGLWNNPEVMKFVGFPYGLKIERDAVEKQLSEQPSGEYDVVLMIMLKESGEIIGNCKLGAPDEENKAHTDVKIEPKFWGNKYGVEVKRALLDYLFTNTDCTEVTADPNRNNIASVKMQEAVGGVRIAEGTHTFPEHLKDFTCDVPFYTYTVTRQTWERRKLSDNQA